METLTFEQLPSAFTRLFTKLESIETLLRQPLQSTEPGQFLTIQEAGELIKLAPPTIYGLVSKNEIPFSKKGKRLYFSKTDLISWVQEGRNKTKSELKGEQYLKKKKGVKDA